MRGLLLGAVALLTIPFIEGCGQNLASKDFGTVVDGIPHVEGADQPFEMPKLGPPPSEEVLRRIRH
jgi:hypothetical protein